MSDSKTATPNHDDMSSEQATQQKTTHKPSTIKRWPLFLLAFIVGSAVSFLALNYQDLQQNLSPTSNRPATLQNPPLKATQSFKPQPIPLATPISSEEANVLMQSMSQLTLQMNSLQTELESLKQQQQLVQSTQANIEYMQLNARLARIDDPASHLTQIQLAWQEISLLPSLNQAQHEQAIDMLKLAQKKILQVQQWQQDIDVIIASLQLNHYDNIIPNAMPEAPDAWLQWIANQFSLKPTQSSEQLSLNKLKQKLLHIKQNMNLELWPHGREWAQLRAQLQLHLIAISDAKRTSTLTLPEHFSDIEKQLIELRSTANQWLKEQ